MRGLNPCRSFIVVFVLLLASGCNRLDWAVRFANLFLLHEADRFFDLNSTQTQELKPDLEKVLKDLRREDFPLFAELLEQVDQKIAAESVERSDIDEWIKKGERIVHRSLGRFEQMTQKIVLSAQKTQEETLAKEIRSQNKDMAKDLETPERRLKSDRQRLIKWLGDFIDFNREQEKALDAFASEHPFPLDLQIKNREKLLEDFLATKGPARTAWIHQFYEDANSLMQPDYKRARDQWQNEFKDYLTRLHQSLTADQKKSLRKNLQSKAADFRRLSDVR